VDKFELFLYAKVKRRTKFELHLGLLELLVGRRSDAQQLIEPDGAKPCYYFRSFRAFLRPKSQVDWKKGHFDGHRY
jgi:hypothetical protein